MVDAFSDDNGATRFVPRGRCEHEAVIAAGSRGSLVVYDGGLLHGYGANRAQTPRRSLQGAFVRRDVRQGIDQRARLTPETAARLDARARYLLDVE
jgi:ectoine hydroxylase-related dioxygenase (phytanoyl-CoA dioxygenase family)